MGVCPSETGGVCPKQLFLRNRGCCLGGFTAVLKETGGAVQVKHWVLSKAVVLRNNESSLRETIARVCELP